MNRMIYYQNFLVEKKSCLQGNNFLEMQNKFITFPFYRMLHCNLIQLLYSKKYHKGRSYIIYFVVPKLNNEICKGVRYLT